MLTGDALWCLFVCFSRYFDSGAQKINGFKRIQANSNTIPFENIKEKLSFSDVFMDIEVKRRPQMG